MMPPIVRGIGVDFVDGRRIQRLVESAQGIQFVRKIFTSCEQAYASTHQAPWRVYAKRFAVKEAFAKAVGTGLGAVLGWRDICVHKDVQGQPYACLSDAGYQRCCEVLGRPFMGLVSVTDQGDCAAAFALIQEGCAQAIPFAPCACVWDMRGLLLNG